MFLPILKNFLLTKPFKGLRLVLIASLLACSDQIFSLQAQTAEYPNHQAGSVKLLTIGNSFADNAVEYLPAFAKLGGRQLLVMRANLSGHSLAQHASYLPVKGQNQPATEPHPYKNIIDPRTHEKRDFSLREALTCEDWDVVTIQQASIFSYQPESYQPYADILIAYIHQYAPHAKILIHETWAYPADYLQKMKNNKLSQQVMYDGLNSAYQKLGAQTGLSLIPVGDAFQQARSQPQPIALNIVGDKHANAAGKYLAAAVFYEELYGANVEPVAVVRPEIPAELATRLRRLAHETVAANKNSGAKVDRE